MYGGYARAGPDACRPRPPRISIGRCPRTGKPPPATTGGGSAGYPFTQLITWGGVFTPSRCSMEQGRAQATIFKRRRSRRWRLQHHAAGRGAAGYMGRWIDRRHERADVMTRGSGGGAVPVRARQSPASCRPVRCGWRCWAWRWPLLAQPVFAVVWVPPRVIATFHRRLASTVFSHCRRIDPHAPAGGMRCGCWRRIHLLRVRAAALALAAGAPARRGHRHYEYASGKSPDLAHATCAARRS